MSKRTQTKTDKSLPVFYPTNFQHCAQFLCDAFAPLDAVFLQSDFMSKFSRIPGGTATNFSRDTGVYKNKSITLVNV